MKHKTYKTAFILDRREYNSYRYLQIWNENNCGLDNFISYIITFHVRFLFEINIFTSSICPLSLSVFEKKTKWSINAEKRNQWK